MICGRRHGTHEVLGLAVFAWLATVLAVVLGSVGLFVDVGGDDLRALGALQWLVEQVGLRQPEAGQDVVLAFFTADVTVDDDAAVALAYGHRRLVVRVCGVSALGFVAPACAAVGEAVVVERLERALHGYTGEVVHERVPRAGSGCGP
jgi:hypothetical protein